MVHINVLSSTQKMLPQNCNIRCLLNGSLSCQQNTVSILPGSKVRGSGSSTEEISQDPVAIKSHRENSTNKPFPKYDFIGYLAQIYHN